MKTIYLAGLIIAAALIAASTVVSAANAQIILGDQGKKKPKDNNVKVQVRIKGITSEKELKVVLQIVNQKAVSKTVVINDTDTDSSATVVMFNKLTAAKGDSFNVAVNNNNAAAQGTIKDLKKPNKITLALS